MTWQTSLLMVQIKIMRSGMTTSRGTVTGAVTGAGNRGKIAFSARMRRTDFVTTMLLSQLDELRSF